MQSGEGNVTQSNHSNRLQPSHTFQWELKTQSKRTLMVLTSRTTDYFHSLSPGPSVTQHYTHPENGEQRCRKTFKVWGKNTNAGRGKRDYKFRLASSSDTNRKAGRRECETTCCQSTMNKHDSIPNSRLKRRTGFVRGVLFV